MKAEPIIPRFEGDGEPRFSPKPLGVGQQRPQGIGGGVEQHIPHDPGIGSPEGVERMGDREDDVIVPHRQQLRPARFQPLPPLPPGAAGTPAMPATVVVNKNLILYQKSENKSVPPRH
jgi:hypothetical protein